MLAEELAHGGEPRSALAAYESIRRVRTEAVLKISRLTDKVAQLASPLGCRLRNAAVRRMPERAQRHQLEPLFRHESQRGGSADRAIGGVLARRGR